MATKKERLDILVYERGFTRSRSRAQAIIMAGDVLVDGRMVDKAGTKFSLDVDITVKEKPPFVSRGGKKLAGALDTFNLDISGRICADVGASTGGFTDCLLQNDVQRVYAIDVGYGQLAYKLRTDERVTVMERTNARYVEALDEPIDLAVIDASFISLQLLLPAVIKWLKPQADIVALIKPQFEAGRDDVSKGGIVNDAEIHERVIREVASFAQSLGLHIAGLMRSPIEGAKSGNTEFLIWLQQGEAASPIDLDAALLHALDPN